MGLFGELVVLETLRLLDILLGRVGDHVALVIAPSPGRNVSGCPTVNLVHVSRCACGHFRRAQMRVPPNGQIISEIGAFGTRKRLWLRRGTKNGTRQATVNYNHPWVVERDCTGPPTASCRAMAQAKHLRTATARPRGELDIWRISGGQRPACRPFRHQTKPVSLRSW